MTILSFGDFFKKRKRIKDRLSVGAIRQYSCNVLSVVGSAFCYNPLSIFEMYNSSDHALLLVFNFYKKNPPYYINSTQPSVNAHAGYVMQLNPSKKQPFGSLLSLHDNSF